MSENATGCRGMVQELGSDAVQFSIKQDPFRVIHRFTAKVKGSQSKILATNLSDAIYRIDDEPSVMEEKVKAVIDAVPATALNCSRSKRDGSLVSFVGEKPCSIREEHN